MKLSEIKPSDMVVFARIGERVEDVVDKDLLQPMLTAAVQYVLNYTGIEEKDADKYEDLSIAALVLASDMYENRIFSVETRRMNPIVTGILNMHSINLL